MTPRVFRDRTEAGRVLATSIDLEETIEAVVRTAIPNLATAIEVNIVGESGELRPLPWIFHADPNIEQMLREMRRQYPTCDPNHPILEVFRSGRPFLSSVERLVLLAEYKRRQAAPGVKMTKKAFGVGRKYPITNGYRDESDFVPREQVPHLAKQGVQ